MSRLLPCTALAAALALGTWLAGWWAVPAIAALYGLLAGARARSGVEAAVAAAFAWGGLLLAFRLAGFPIGALAGRLAGVVQLPEPALYAAVVLLPALLAGSAAALGGALRRHYVSAP